MASLESSGMPVSIGFEVVDEEDVLDAESTAHELGVEGPGEVGEFEAAVADRARAAEAGGLDLRDEVLGLVAVGLDGSFLTTSSSEGKSAAGNFFSRFCLIRPFSNS